MRVGELALWCCGAHASRRDLTLPLGARAEPHCGWDEVVALIDARNKRQVRGPLQKERDQITTGQIRRPAVKMPVQRPIIR